MGKEHYYFTFGSYQDDDTYVPSVQPILASTWESARRKMYELHGGKLLAFQYDEKQWQERNRMKLLNWNKYGIRPMEEKELPVVEGD